MDIREACASKENAGERLDVYVSEVVEEIARSGAQRLISEGAVLVNGKAESKNYRICEGDEVRIELPAPKELEATPQEIEIEIVYEDESLVVVNKPKGMVVHPAAGNPDGTLVNALLYHCKGRLSSINGVIRPGIVHRIDKDTSGLLVVAKTDVAHHSLAAQIKEHSFTRIYEAIVCGNMKDDEGFVEAPIGRDSRDRKKMAVTEKNSKYAYTSYEVVERYNGFTHLRLKLKTGRTHQIRVHMSYIGRAVAGDEVYGGKNKSSPPSVKELEGQCLHAKTLGFIHPVSNEYMEFNSELPEYFIRFKKKLENSGFAGE